MLVNRAIERWRRRDQLALRTRALRARPGRPLVIVPSILGTRIIEGGKVLWGTAPRLYRGPPVATAADAVASGLLEGFALIPGVYAYDVFGGLLRFLDRVGGYHRGRDLFVLEYDWRRSVEHGAARLAELLDAVEHHHRGDIDVVAISTGGLLVRHCLAMGRSLRRIIYIGTPHRGSFQAITSLHAGLQMVPLGRRFPPEEIAACETCWDALPHPDERVVVDAAGTVLDDSLYDPATWRRMQLGSPSVAVGRHLERAARLHRVLDAAPVHGDSWVIGSRHLPTLSKLVLVNGRATVLPCTPRAADPITPHVFEPGDSSLPARSLLGLPGLDPRRVRTVAVDDHHTLPADPAVHRHALEILLEP